ncbi:hypothetical protein ACP275_08G257400 [Erythranthe tilingii]
MASPSTITGNSSGSDFQSSQENTTDVRKRKRMLSNRESARRSRMRKQKHLDDLKSQLTNLRAENHSILTNMNLVAQLQLNMESENSVLRAQISELHHRLLSLNDIVMISCMRSKESTNNSTTALININNDDYGDHHNHQMVINGGGGVVDDFLIHNHWGLVHVNQPIMY